MVKSFCSHYVHSSLTNAVPGFTFQINCLPYWSANLVFWDTTGDTWLSSELCPFWKRHLLCPDLFVQHSSNPGSTGRWVSVSGTATEARSPAYAHWHTKRKHQLNTMLFKLSSHGNGHFKHFMPLPFTRFSFKVHWTLKKKRTFTSLLHQHT